MRTNRKWKKPRLKHGKLTKWNWLIYYPKNIQIGKNTDIGAFSCLFAHHPIIIEKNVKIGSHCSFYSMNTENNTEGKIIIRQGAMIGSHSIIYPNVIVEQNEKIPARSIIYVNKKNERVIK